MRAWLAADRKAVLAGAVLIEINNQQHESMSIGCFSQGAISKNFSPLSCAFYRFQV
jgi:hypothetical protein